MSKYNYKSLLFSALMGVASTHAMTSKSFADPGTSPTTLPENHYPISTWKIDDHGAKITAPLTPEEFDRMFLNFNEFVKMTFAPAPFCQADSPTTDPTAKKRNFKMIIAIVGNYGPDGQTIEDEVELAPANIVPEIYTNINYDKTQMNAGKTVKQIVDENISAISSHFSWLKQDQDQIRNQIATSALIQGMATFFDPTATDEKKKENSIKATQWAVDQIKKMGITNDKDLLGIIATLNGAYGDNYYDPRNPGGSGANGETRTISQMAAGYDEYIRKLAAWRATGGHGNPPDNTANGGVCDDIMAAGCQLYNESHGYNPKSAKACKLVGVQTGGLQHWVMLVPQPSNEYLLLDYSRLRDYHGDGNFVSEAGNPSLKIPIAMVTKDGKVTIVDFQDGETQKFINAISNTTPLDNSSNSANLNQDAYTGKFQAAKLMFEFAKRKRIHRVTISGGQGKETLQNLGTQIWGVSVKVEGASTFEEAKRKLGTSQTLVVSYTNLAIPETKDATGQTIQTAEVRDRFAGIFVMPVGPVKVELSAGLDVTAGTAITKDAHLAFNLEDSKLKVDQNLVETVGASGGGNFFAQVLAKGGKQLTSTSALSGTVLFSVSGIPGIDISELHGIANGESLGNGLKGFYAKYNAQADVKYQIDPSNQVSLSASYSRSPATGQGLSLWASYQKTKRKYVLNTSGYMLWSKDNPAYSGVKFGVKEQVDFSLRDNRGHKYVISPYLYGQINAPEGGGTQFGGAGLGVNLNLGK